MRFLGCRSLSWVLGNDVPFEESEQGLALLLHFDFLGVLVDTDVITGFREGRALTGSKGSSARMRAISVGSKTSGKTMFYFPRRLWFSIGRIGRSNGHQRETPQSD